MDPAAEATAPLIIDDLLSGMDAFEPTPVQIAMIAIVNIGILLLPALVLLTAVLKLRRFPEHRALHWALLLSSALAVLLSTVTLLVPGLFSEAWRQSGVLSFTWVFLFAWMALDFFRSARRTGLRPRTTDIAVLVCAAAVVLTFLSPFVMY
jgi:hypothetical membrane protein